MGKYVQTLGAKKLSLHILGHNTRAIHLYQKLNFQITDLVMSKNDKGICMKSIYIILATLTVETLIIWFASYLLGWNFIDTILLGSLLLFGIVYLFRLYIHQTNATFNANIAGWTWEEAGIGPFHFRISPIIIGLILFIVISILVTFITYYRYFFD